jgi:hypothetical protein
MGEVTAPLSVLSNEPVTFISSAPFPRIDAVASSRVFPLRFSVRWTTGMKIALNTIPSFSFDDSVESQLEQDH